MSEIIHVTFAALELRVPSMAERLVEGIVVPWDETSRMTADPAGERFRRGSLTRSLKERGHLVKLYRAHDHSTPLGTPVDFKPNHEAGCWAQFRVTKKPIGDELLGDIAEGLFDAFSVGFIPLRETRAADGAREIVEARLHEVSVCPMGAYDGARVLAMRQPAAALYTPPPMPEVNLSPVILPSRWGA